MQVEYTCNKQTLNHNEMVKYYIVEQSKMKKTKNFLKKKVKESIENCSAQPCLADCS